MLIIQIIFVAKDKMNLDWGTKEIPYPISLFITEDNFIKSTYICSIMFPVNAKKEILIIHQIVFYFTTPLALKFALCLLMAFTNFHCGSSVSNELANYQQVLALCWKLAIDKKHCIGFHVVHRDYFSIITNTFTFLHF